ncbi:MAG: prepilin-type N-terminal cleavage/methylation domain-containing protein [Lentimonas sp.]|jgi:prepilin-type N-terminal cleavage/methylation domain-containing protein
MTIFSNGNPVVERRRTKGFTLVEMMVVVVLLGMASAMMMPTMVFFSKSMLGVGNYSLMSAQSRTALEIFSRDLHVAEVLTAASQAGVSMTLPADLDSAVVVYTYDANAKELVRSVTPSGGSTKSRTLFGDVHSFEFVYYNRLGVDVSADASILSESKSVQINAKLLKDVGVIDNTDYIISARFLMRNI